MEGKQSKKKKKQEKGSFARESERRRDEISFWEGAWWVVT